MPNGEDPPRAHIFMVTHTRKNGNPVDEASAEIIVSIFLNISLVVIYLSLRCN